jgi:hypothetical protein
LIVSFLGGESVGDYSLKSSETMYVFCNHYFGEGYKRDGHQQLADLRTNQTLPEEKLGEKKQDPNYLLVVEEKRT